MSPQSPIPSRRAVLTAVGLGLLGCATLSACTGSDPPAPRRPVAVGPDQLAVARTVIDARDLLAGAIALGAAQPPLRALLTRVADVHRAHLQALGATPTAGTTTKPTPTSTSTPTPTSTPTAQPEATAGQLASAEWAAARNALRDGAAASPAIAVLLCRIAGARAVHADLVQTASGRPDPGGLVPAPALPATRHPATPTRATAPTPATPTSATPTPATTAPAATITLALAPPILPTTARTSRPVSPGSGTTPSSTIVPMPPATASALNRLLAGEHAAVYAYPLVIAHAAPNRSALASTLWQDHRQERDLIETRLLAAGVTPVASAPAYDIGPLLTSPARTAALAARVETGLAALAADLIATATVITTTTTSTATTSTATNRDFGADQLVLAARRTAAWTGRPDAFPGLTPPATSPATTPASTLNPPLP